MKKRILILVAVILVLLIGFFLLMFPGRQALFAITLGTGIGRARMQENVDALEQKAIKQKTFTFHEKEFLKDLYETMATGAIILPPLRQSGRLMTNYLSGSGDAFELDDVIFTENRTIQKHMEILRKQVIRQPANGANVCSNRFYMPDKNVPDSVLGLYWGTLCARLVADNDGRTIIWRAEVPWTWPSYEFLNRKYGSPHAESFPVPNLRSLIFGKHYSLFIDNGLGEYLTHLSLAKSFLAYGEWSEDVSRDEFRQ